MKKIPLHPHHSRDKMRNLKPFELDLFATVLQGEDFKNNQTTKQLNKFIQTNRKVETKPYLLPIGPNFFLQLCSCLIVFKIPSLSVIVSTKKKYIFLEGNFLLYCKKLILFILSRKMGPKGKTQEREARWETWLIPQACIYTFHLQKREVKKAFEEKGKGVLAQSNMSSCLLHYVLLLCILYFLRLSKKKLLSVGLSVSTSVSMYVCLISLQSYPKIYLLRQSFGSTVRLSVYFSAVFCLSGPLIQPQARSSPPKNLLFSIILGKPKKKILP